MLKIRLDDLVFEHDAKKYSDAMTDIEAKIEGLWGEEYAVITQNGDLALKIDELHPVDDTVIRTYDLYTVPFEAWEFSKEKKQRYKDPDLSSLPF